MKILKKHIGMPIIALLLVFFTFTACDNSTNPLDIDLFSPSDDVQLGAQVDSQIKADPGQFPIYYDANATPYVQSIVDEILNSPLIQYKGTFVYKAQIIKDDKTVNAFATPGGYVYVYTGLLKFVDNEATLAGVLAHEIAHAERRHATKRMTKAYGIQILTSVLLGQNPSQIAEIGANLFTGLALLKNSRDDEAEADEYSFKYLQSSKWYPGAILFFFNKINDNQGSSFLEELLSDHPLTQDRIDAVQKQIKDANLPAPTESNTFSQRYQQFKAKLP